jgi:hypothetical protein
MSAVLLRTFLQPTICSSAVGSNILLATFYTHKNSYVKVYISDSRWEYKMILNKFPAFAFNGMTDQERARVRM